MNKNSLRNRTGKPFNGWILPYIHERLFRFIAAAVIGTLAVACTGGLMFTSGYLISRSSLQPENILMVYVPIVLVRTFGFSKAVIQYLERLFSHDTVLRLLSSMRMRLYNILEPQALQLRSRYRTGDLLGLLAEDIEQLQHVFLRLSLPASTAVLIYGAGIAAIGRMDGSFALLMAFYCGFLLFAVPLFALMISRRHRRRYITERSKAYEDLTDAVFGISDWILSGRTDHFLRSFTERQTSMTRIEKRMRRNEWRMQWISQCLIGGAVIFMALWAAQLSKSGVMSPEWIASYALVTFPLLEAFVRAGEAVIRAPDYNRSAQRLKQVERAADAGWQPANIESDAVNNHRLVVQANQGAELKLDQVFFRYPGSKAWNVEDITLHVPQGGKVAVIGRSGAGKSTLMQLILGELTPAKGTVTINGVPVRETASHRGRLFAMLNQKPHLFDTTIINNIRLGRPNASDEEVRKAAELAGLLPLIESLPHAFETRVREAGVRFSGGERQRIALARILLMDCPIVLFDEPTVGLDPITEQKIISTIFAALDGKTLFWISHHLSGMEQMDQIIFMENGRIAMQGTHAQLMTAHERYRKLYALDNPLS